MKMFVEIVISGETASAESWRWELCLACWGRSRARGCGASGLVWVGGVGGTGAPQTVKDLTDSGSSLSELGDRRRDLSRGSLGSDLIINQIFFVGNGFRRLKVGTGVLQ